MQRTILIIIFLFPTLTFSQNSLILTKKERKAFITNNNSITVCTLPTTKDNFARAYYGKFKELSGDSLKIVVNEMEWQVPPKNRKTYGKRYPKDTIVNLPIINIDLILRTRENFENTTNVIAFLSLISATIISPLVSIDMQKEGFQWSRWRKVSGVSISVFTLTVVSQICFGEKRYRIQAKRKNLWKIEH
ncbi:MAG: hypothetical protein ACT4ON_15625 [Bacteroidota bacterium]